MKMTLYRSAAGPYAKNRALHTHAHCSMIRGRGRSSVAVETIEDVDVRVPEVDDRSWVKCFLRDESIGRLCRSCESRLRQAIKTGVVTIRTKPENAMCPRCGHLLPRQSMPVRGRIYEYRCSKCGAGVTVKFHITCEISAPSEVKP